MELIYLSIHKVPLLLQCLLIKKSKKSFVQLEVQMYLFIFYSYSCIILQQHCCPIILLIMCVIWYTDIYQGVKFWKANKKGTSDLTTLQNLFTTGLSSLNILYSWPSSIFSILPAAKKWMTNTGIHYFYTCWYVAQLPGEREMSSHTNMTLLKLGQSILLKPENTVIIRCLTPFIAEEYYRRLHTKPPTIWCHPTKTLLMKPF